MGCCGSNHPRAQISFAAHTSPNKRQVNTKNDVIESELFKDKLARIESLKAESADTMSQWSENVTTIPTGISNCILDK